MAIDDLPDMSRLIDAGIKSNSRVFFIRGDSVAIVDSGAPGNERQILRALREAGIPAGSVSILIATHAHWDHCGSLRALQAALGAPAAAGWPDAEYMEKGLNAPVENSTAKHASHLEYPAVKAGIVVAEDMSLKAYGIDARIIRTPGHTAGSISVLASSGDCAVGDFLAGLYTGDPETIRNCLLKMKEFGARRIFPAHGPGVLLNEILR